MPKPICNYTKEQLRKLTTKIGTSKAPHYVVKKITTRERADGKGSYDIVDFEWKYVN